MKYLKTHIVLLSFVLVALSACAPKVYVIDRQTVLEQESAGEWPELEQSLIAQTPQSTATPLSNTKVSARRARLYNVLDGELVGARQGSAQGVKK